MIWFEDSEVPKIGKEIDTTQRNEKAVCQQKSVCRFQWGKNPTHSESADPFCLTFWKFSTMPREEIISLVKNVFDRLVSKLTVQNVIMTLIFKIHYG